MMLPPSTYNVEQLAGEKTVMINVACDHRIDNTREVIIERGYALMTTYRFHFLPLLKNIVGDQQDRRFMEYYNVPLGCIAKLEKKGNLIKIRTKDIRKFVFVFPRDVINRVFDILYTYVFPEDINNLFAFSYKLPKENDKKNCENHGSTPKYMSTELEMEWIREGIVDDPKWRLSTVNSHFRLIPTYPEIIVVPSNVSDDTLEKATQFRSLGRIPALCWMNRCNGAVLSRCSQPKIGMGNSSCIDDEQLVAAIFEANYTHQELQIIDCRPRSNAMANKAKGYGVESTANYPNSNISFMNIPNIHAMRESFKKLRQLVLSYTVDNLLWWGKVEDTKWLYYIRLILKASLRIANSLHLKGESVLVHCSHGWDRTSQIVSLAQMIVDPYFRTLKGFKVLIEKEWLAFGHPFQLRQSHGEKADTQESPVFIQFLDCVWQLISLYPSYFEFNGALLVFLADQVHSCRFGNFLLDCTRARIEADLYSRTESVWDLMNFFRDEFSQSHYVPDQPLLPHEATVLRGVTFWSELYLRWSVQRPHNWVCTSVVESTSQSSSTSCASTESFTINSISSSVGNILACAQSEFSSNWSKEMEEYAEVNALNSPDFQLPSSTIELVFRIRNGAGCSRIRYLKDRVLELEKKIATQEFLSL